jgi:hypothetical protein
VTGLAGDLDVVDTGRIALERRHPRIHVSSFVGRPGS